jgi:U4/U6 small nuclear ribonucleoprotein PRP3
MNVPDVEWWDAKVLVDKSYDSIGDEGIPPNLKPKAITGLIQHPIEVEPPVDPNADVDLPIMLTKKERKKMPVTC